MTNRHRTDAPQWAKATALGMGFATAKILLTALELGVFTVLADGPRTQEQLRKELELHGRGLDDFLAALTAFGLLVRTGDGYRNAPVAARHLVRGPHYDGGFLEGANAVLYPAWGGLTSALRTGAPQNTGDFEEMLDRPERRRMYHGMMDSLSAPLAPGIAEALDWSRHTSVTDVGGARGNLVSLLLHAHPHLSGVVFDRPQNGPDVAEHAARTGVGDRVSFVGGDFFTDALPPGDVVVIGHVLADFSEAQRTALIRSAYRSLRPGGALVVYDPMPDTARPDPLALIGSLHMLVMSPAGAGYPPHRCAEWLTQAGFCDVSVWPAVLGNTLVVGHRAAGT
ncbi:methyltransferase [Streptomyces sp. NPDC055299]